MNLSIYILAIFTVLSSAEEICMNHNLRRIYSYDDRKIDQSVLWSKSHVNMYQCLAECVQNLLCVSVHVSQSDNACFAFGKRFDDVTASTTDAPGYMLYQTSKATVCENCVAMPPAGECDVGYGVFISACRPVTECLTFGNELTLFEGHVIFQHDFTTYIFQTRDSCMMKCIDNPACNNVDFDTVVGGCYLQQVTWLDDSLTDSDRDTDSLIFDHYQRVCSTWP